MQKNATNHNRFWARCRVTLVAVWANFSGKISPNGESLQNPVTLLLFTYVSQLRNSQEVAYSAEVASTVKKRWRDSAPRCYAMLRPIVTARSPGDKKPSVRGGSGSIFTGLGWP
jgi:hypothetical protein